MCVFVYKFHEGHQQPSLNKLNYQHHLPPLNPFFKLYAIIIQLIFVLFTTKIPLYDHGFRNFVTVLWLLSAKRILKFCGISGPPYVIAIDALYLNFALSQEELGK